MLGSVWGWIYSKISPVIKGRLRRSERRLKAAIRLLAKTWRESESVRRYEDYTTGQGITNDMTFLNRMVIKYKYLREQDSRRKAGLLTAQQYHSIHENYLAATSVITLSVGWLMKLVAYHSQLISFKTIDAITLSIFSGKTARLLFVLGFALWNVSKIVSLCIATH